MSQKRLFLVTSFLFFALAIGAQRAEDAPLPVPEEARTFRIAAATDEPTAVPTPVQKDAPTAKPTQTPTASPEPTPFLADEWLREAIASNGIPLPDGEVLKESEYARSIGVTEEDLILAAKVSYYEAGAGATEEAHRAVLCVIYNRCIATRFGGEITDIPTEVFRSGQFSVIGHRNFKHLKPPEELVEYARDIFQWGNLSLPEDVLFFHAAFRGKQWRDHKFYRNIGGNLFFRGKTE